MIQQRFQSSGVPEISRSMKDSRIVFIFAVIQWLVIVALLLTVHGLHVSAKEAIQAFGLAVRFGSEGVDGSSFRSLKSLLLVSSIVSLVGVASLIGGLALFILAGFQSKKSAGKKGSQNGVRPT